MTKTKLCLRVWFVILILVVSIVTVSLHLLMISRSRGNLEETGRSFMSTLNYMVSDTASIPEPPSPVLEEGGEGSMKHDSGVLYAFTMRTALRLTSVQPPPPGMHIYDFVDVYAAKQTPRSPKMQLFLDAQPVLHSPDNTAYSLPCSTYDGDCYKNNMLDVFRLVLNKTRADYFFFMEADNELCVSLDTIQEIALKHKRYFIGTGVGASGWIMSRQFVQDFRERYAKAPKNQVCPDCEAANMLVERKPHRWAVTRKYYVAHTLSPSVGVQSLNGHGDKPELKKHLPRCFEPHRGLWANPKNPTKDQFGWDYFDYSDDRCRDSDIYPCWNVTDHASEEPKDIPMHN